MNATRLRRPSKKNTSRSLSNGPHLRVPNHPQLRHVEK